MNARENQILTSYGWVDRKAGTVRIPIERAMDLIAHRGLAAGPRPNALPPGREAAPAQGRMR